MGGEPTPVGPPPRGGGQQLRGEQTVRNRDLISARIILVLTVVASAASGCGGAGRRDVRAMSAGASIHWLGTPRPISGVRQRTVGHGAHAAVLLWRAGRRPPREAIVFLHGWQLLPPSAYGGWLRHLVDRGNTVVYPVYENRDTKPEAFRPNALAGIAAGLRAANADPAHVVAAGVTTGGALAFDYAATAPRVGLPAPRAVLAVFPGRNPGDGVVTPANLSDIPARTLLAAVAGPGDPLPHGEETARALLGAATRVPTRDRLLLRAARLGHDAQMLDSAAAQLTFWKPLDNLIAQARAGAR